MAVYRVVKQSFWTDSKVDDEFTPEDKYFYLYLITNPHTNICGCYELGEKQCCRETGYNSETISRLLKRFEYVHNVIRYNPKEKEVLILNWYKHNWTSSEKLIKSVRDVAQYIKTPCFRGYIFDLLEREDNTVSIPYPYPMDTSVSVSVSDTVSVKRITKPKKEVFTAPTLEEIQEYVKERNSTVDAKQFYDYFTAGHWIDSKGNPVRNWKQKLITWEKGDANGRNKSVSGTDKGNNRAAERDYSYLYDF